mmetsp:Transcript_63580/g.151665  ORF Transcript_63580/g.151665 Transcript_63580/m.151665 type:complete len:223 (-) Transcript_63580:47-715(-)
MLKGQHWHCELLGDRHHRDLTLLTGCRSKGSLGVLINSGFPCLVRLPRLRRALHGLDQTRTLGVVERLKAEDLRAQLLLLDAENLRSVALRVKPEGVAVLALSPAEGVSEAQRRLLDLLPAAAATGTAGRGVLHQHRTRDETLLLLLAQAVQVLLSIPALGLWVVPCWVHRCWQQARGAAAAAATLRPFQNRLKLRKLTHDVMPADPSRRRGTTLLAILESL